MKPEQDCLIGKYNFSYKGDGGLVNTVEHQIKQ